MLCLPFNWAGRVCLGFFSRYDENSEARDSQSALRTIHHFQALLSCQLFSLSTPGAENPPRQGKVSLYFLIWNPFERGQKNPPFSLMMWRPGRTRANIWWVLQQKGSWLQEGFCGTGMVSWGCTVFAMEKDKTFSFSFFLCKREERQGSYILTSSFHFILTSGLNWVKKGWRKVLWS